MKSEYNPVLSLQKYDLSINQLFLFLNQISIFKVCEQLQQLKLRQHRVSDGSLQFLFSMYSSISLLYLSIFCLCYTDINCKSKDALKTLSRY